MRLTLCFSRPTKWWGWLICGYQLLRGVRYWQISHVEILAPGGVFAYRLDDTCHGFATEFPTGPCFPHETRASHPQMVRMSQRLSHLWGHFSPLSPLNGCNCCSYVRIVGGLSPKYKTNLPGQLLWELERDRIHSASNQDED